MSALRIGFVTQWFLPEPVLVPRWIVDSLTRRGAAVRVLTGIPNYPTGRTHPGYRPWQARSERIDGVAVDRTPLVPSHGSSGLGRVANYLSWALSATVLGSRVLKSADVVLVYSSPATAAVPAMVARVRWRVPYVLLVQDVWPDSVLASGMVGPVPKRVSRILDFFVRGTYRMASQVVVTSPGMLDLLESRGVPRSKLTLVYNWIGDDGERVLPAVRARESIGVDPGDFVLMYAGNLGVAQGLESVIEAMGTLPPTSRCRLVMVGDGICRESLKELAESTAPGRVIFLGTVPRYQMPDLMGAADAQVVSLADWPLFDVTTPSKLQAALAAGQPIIASAGNDVRQIVQTSGAGIGVPPGRPADLAAAMEKMSRLSPDELTDMGSRGRAFYQSSMQESVGGSRLFHCLRTVGSSNVG